MLSIQKIVVLLNDFHFNELENHLVKIKASLPHKLIKLVRKPKYTEAHSDVLCEVMYNDISEKTKKRFFQLAHYTFKLTSYLSRNFPSYLSHNFDKVEALINTGETKKANTLAECLLDICEKTEDHSNLLKVTKFLAQQAFIQEQTKDAIRYHNRIADVLKCETNLNELYITLREKLNFKSKNNLTTDQLNKLLKYFEQYHKSPSFAVRALSKFASVYSLSFSIDNRFYNQETYSKLTELEKELDNNQHIIFPFLEDVLFKIYYLKLQYKIHEYDDQSLLDESLKIIQSSSHLKFWQNYLNVPELSSIAIQTSHYLSHYSDTYREDFYETLPDEVKEHIEYLKGKCEEMLARPIWNDGYLVKLINLKSLYSGLLILGDKRSVKKAINLLEEMLISYQQISFHKFLDGIFGSLMIAYFSLQEYDKVAECYKRYKKLTSENQFNEENDIIINALYYSSQYIQSHRKQYIDKLYNTLLRTEGSNNLLHVKKTILDMAKYFNIPFSAKQVIS